jgi:hypothetical protein
MPKKLPPSQTAERFIVRLPDGMRDRIARAAKDNNRSMNQELVSLLEAHYPEPPTMEEINAELRLLTRTIKSPMSKFDLSETLNLIGKLRDKLAEMPFPEGDDP